MKFWKRDQLIIYRPEEEIKPPSPPYEGPHRMRTGYTMFFTLKPVTLREYLLIKLHGGGNSVYLGRKRC